MVPAEFHEAYDRRRAVAERCGPLSLRHGPHYTEMSRVFLVEGTLARQHLPQDDAETENVAFLRIRAGGEDFGRHPGGGALVVGHLRLLVDGGAEVADFQLRSAGDEEEIGRF